jgi:hypothetical protein
MVASPQNKKDDVMKALVYTGPNTVIFRDEPGRFLTQEKFLSWSRLLEFVGPTCMPIMVMIHDVPLH